MPYKTVLTSLALMGTALVVALPSHASVIAPSIDNGVNAHVIHVSAESEKAEAFISNLTSKGIGFLKKDGLSAAERKAEFSKLLNKNFDVDTIARFALGKYWRNASKEQRSEYLKLFKTMIVDVYSRRFGDYQGQEIKVTGARKEGARDVLVHSILDQKSGPDVRVDWRVRDRGGDFRVIDVVVEGVSLSLTQRSDFASVIQRGGGEVEALLQNLRK